MRNWDMEIPNCVPEYFREQREKYEHGCELKHEMHEHFRANQKKVDEAYEAGFPILDYDGYKACADCKDADHDTQCFEDDDFARVICKNPDCPEHKKHKGN